MCISNLGCIFAHGVDLNEIRDYLLYSYMVVWLSLHDCWLITCIYV